MLYSIVSQRLGRDPQVGRKRSFGGRLVTVCISASGNFFKTAREAQLPLKFQNIYGQICTIVLTF